MGPEVTRVEGDVAQRQWRQIGGREEVQGSPDGVHDGELSQSQDVLPVA